MWSAFEYDEPWPAALGDAQLLRMLDMHPTYTEITEVMPEQVISDLLLIKRIEGQWMQYKYADGGSE